MKKILGFLFLTITAISFSQEKVLLRLNYENGDVYQVDASIKQDMGEFLKMDIIMKMDMEVTEAKENSYLTETSFKNIKMDMNTMGKKMQYDSDTKESEMDDFSRGVHSEMKKLLTTLVSFEFDKRGNVVETKVISGESQAKDFEQSMGAMVLPEEAVTIGSTWSFKKTSKEGIEMNYIYEVTAINPDNVEVKISGTVTGEEAISGTGLIDRKSGNMSKMDVDMIIKIQGQKVNSKVFLTTTKK